MKNLDDIAKEHGIDNIDLGNAVEAVIASRNASRKGSFLEADGYEYLLSHEFTQAEWDVAHDIVDDYERRVQ